MREDNTGNLTGSASTKPKMAEACPAHPVPLEPQIVYKSVWQHGEIAKFRRLHSIWVREQRFYVHPRADLSDPKVRKLCIGLESTNCPARLSIE